MDPPVTWKPSNNRWQSSFFRLSSFSTAHSTSASLGDRLVLRNFPIPGFNTEVSSESAVQNGSCQRSKLPPSSRSMLEYDVSVDRSLAGGSLPRTLTPPSIISAILKGSKLLDVTDVQQTIYTPSTESSLELQEEPWRAECRRSEPQ